MLPYFGYSLNSVELNAIKGRYEKFKFFKFYSTLYPLIKDVTFHTVNVILH